MCAFYLKIIVAHYNANVIKNYTYVCMWTERASYIADMHNSPHVVGLLDHVPSLWQTLILLVVFSAYPLSSSQTKQAMEPGVTPV